MWLISSIAKLSHIQHLLLLGVKSFNIKSFDLKRLALHMILAVFTHSNGASSRSVYCHHDKQHGWLNEVYRMLFSILGISNNYHPGDMQDSIQV